MGFTAELVGELDLVGDWGLLTTDANLVVTGWNRWLERHAGQPAACVLGRPLFNVFPDLAARNFGRHYRQALDGRVVVLSHGFHKYILPLPPPAAGDRFDRMQQTARIVPLTDGELVRGTVTVVEDVTERAAYEAELRERVEALREADRRKDEFLATLAHELRNPLAPIRNALQILRMADDRELAERTREMIDRQVGNMVRLVDDLLEVSRITSGKVVLQKHRLDLRAVVESAVETSRPLIEAAEHILSIDLPSEPVPVEADLTRLAQVVANLLNNAAKYTPPRGRVGVTVEREAGKALVRVQDTGLGIPPEMLDRVFDLFTQVDRHLERSQGGLGIGLALVRKLTELHGGTVEVQSEGMGRGTQFTLRLPLAGNGHSVSPVLPVVPTPSNLPRTTARRVLVVDDNVDAATSLATVLELIGYQVWVVHDGLAAVAATEEFRPDVVLMDIGMPKLNGYDACRRIREQPWGRDAVLVAVTGWGQDEDRRRTTEAGFDHHLTKPVSSESVTDILTALSRPAGNR